LQEARGGGGGSAGANCFTRAGRRRGGAAGGHRSRHGFASVRRSQGLAGSATF